VTGPVLIYVDDIFSVSLRKDVLRDMELAADYCRKLMGPEAIATSKLVSGRALVTIGYNIDLDQRLLHISGSCAKQALYGYMTTNVSQPITVRSIMRLGSWASRFLSFN
jgi:hypothetical protein